jgi:hypothetical protein
MRACGTPRRAPQRPRNKALEADDLTTLVTLFLEVEPGAPTVSRRVLAIPAGTMAEVSDVARFVDIIEDEHGKQLALYELPPADVDQGERDEAARIVATREEIAKSAEVDATAILGHRDVKPSNGAQPFRAGDVVTAPAGTPEQWVLACYDAVRDDAWMAGYPETLVANASKKLVRIEPATDEQHAAMIADVLASSGPRRAAVEAIQARGGTP